MAHGPVSLALILGGTIAMLGCAGSKTHTSAEAQLDRIAVVVPAYEGIFWLRFVRIRCIASAGRSEEECTRFTPYAPYAHLTPGLYDLDVQFVSGFALTSEPLLDLLTIPIDAVMVAKNRRFRRRITFAVEAGRTYEVYFDPDAARYAVNVRVSTDAKPRRPSLLPPREAHPCLPAPASALPAVPVCAMIEPQ